MQCVFPFAGGLLILITVAASSARGDDALPRVPDGFVVEKVAASPLVAHPMMGCFDDRGRLFLACAAGQNLDDQKLLESLPNYVQMLEDVDGDGRYDKGTVFADKMTMPMGAVWHRGALYVASPPSIWRLEDTDGDGRADRRDEVVNKFGFNGNAADIHGCFLGPEGRIYWTDGRHGHEFTDDQGRVVSKGLAARIFSCKPDGSDVESFAGGGMDNPVEIVFTPEGEMLGTTNIMLSNPRVDTLVHWVDGGVYPRSDQEDCIAEFQRTGDLLPPLAGLGHVAVSGLARYCSAAFGPEYRGNLFVALFNTHSVVRSIVTRSGATFAAEQHEFLVSENPDFHPTDVIEDADGSLLVIDTGGWFRIGCPTSQIAKPDIHGGIYRIRRKGAAPIGDPRGLQLKLEKESPAVLAESLDDSRPAVVERAIDLLAERGEAAVESLAAVAACGSAAARRNAVWTLSRMEAVRGGDVLRTMLKDDSESVRIAAARAIGSVRDAEAVDVLAGLVETDTPAVRREAATALGRIGQAERTHLSAEQRARIVNALFGGLRATAVDRFLEHALVFAVIRVDLPGATIPYLTDANPNVRRAALIALDQMRDGNLQREHVVPLLDTDDPALQQEVLGVIARHEGWAGETLDLLRGWLSEEELSDERQSTLRGFLSARAEDAEIQALVAERLQGEGTSVPVRRLLLEVIERAPLAAAPELWIEALGRGLDDGSSEVAADAVRVIQTRRIDRFDERLSGVAHDATQPKDLRIGALLALASRAAALDEEAFQLLVGELAADVAPLDRLAAARVLAEAPLTDDQLIVLCDRIDEAGPIAAPVLVRAFARSKNDAVGRVLIEALQRDSAVGSPHEFASILSGYSAAIQKQAAPLLAARGLDVEAQRSRLESLGSATTGGSAEHGRDVFFGKKAACSGCHTVRGTGGKVGPDLSTIGSIRTGRDLLEAIVVPSASFAREFNTFVVLTDDGKVHTGIIGRQTTDSISLRTAELAEIRIARDSIEEIRESPTSIMPEGLERILSREELGDVVAYLQSLTGP